MKALIGGAVGVGAVGVAALAGALLLVNTRSTSSAVQASNPAATVGSASIDANPQLSPAMTVAPVRTTGTMSVNAAALSLSNAPAKATFARPVAQATKATPQST